MNGWVVVNYCRLLSLKAFRSAVHRSLQRRCLTTTPLGEAGCDLSTAEEMVDPHVSLSLLKVIQHFVHDKVILSSSHCASTSCM